MSAGDESDETIFSELVFPKFTNHYHTLEGGVALHWMDLAAFTAASRAARAHVVTASCKDVAFLSPVSEGELAEIRARVVRQGARSYEVDVTLIAENLLTGDRRKCVTGRFVCARKRD